MGTATTAPKVTSVQIGSGRRETRRSQARHLADAGQGEEPERALLGDAALGLCVVAWTLTAIAVVAV